MGVFFSVVGIVLSFTNVVTVLLIAFHTIQLYRLLVNYRESRALLYHRKGFHEKPEEDARESGDVKEEKALEKKFGAHSHANFLQTMHVPSLDDEVRSDPAKVTKRLDELPPVSQKDLLLALRTTLLVYLSVGILGGFPFFRALSVGLLLLFPERLPRKVVSWLESVLAKTAIRGYLRTALLKWLVGFAFVGGLEGLVYNVVHIEFDDTKKDKDLPHASVQTPCSPMTPRGEAEVDIDTPQKKRLWKTGTGETTTNAPVDVSGVLALRRWLFGEERNPEDLSGGVAFDEDVPPEIAVAPSRFKKKKKKKREGDDKDEGEDEGEVAIDVSSSSEESSSDEDGEDQDKDDGDSTSSDKKLDLDRIPEIEWISRMEGLIADDETMMSWAKETRRRVRKVTKALREFENNVFRRQQKRHLAKLDYERKRVESRGGKATAVEEEDAIVVATTKQQKRRSWGTRIWSAILGKKKKSVSAEEAAKAAVAARALARKRVRMRRRKLRTTRPQRRTKRVTAALRPGMKKKKNTKSKKQTQTQSQRPSHSASSAIPISISEVKAKVDTGLGLGRTQQRKRHGRSDSRLGGTRSSRSGSKSRTDGLALLASTTGRSGVAGIRKKKRVARTDSGVWSSRPSSTLTTARRAKSSLKKKKPSASGGGGSKPGWNRY